ncbi:MAG: hypothetical protein WC107_01055 [Patescibacteria group bacterium]
MPDNLRDAVDLLLKLRPSYVKAVCYLLQDLAGASCESALEFFRSVLVQEYWTTTVPSVETFDVGAHFRKGETDGVKIAYFGIISPLQIDGIVEENVPEQTLGFCQTKRACGFAEIADAFHQPTTTYFAHIWSLMKEEAPEFMGESKSFIVEVAGKKLHVSCSDSEGTSYNDKGWHIHICILGEEGYIQHKGTKVAFPLFLEQ